MEPPRPSDERSESAEHAAVGADDRLPDPASRPGDLVSALERGVAVLGCFTPQVRTLGNNELARLTGIPKATVTRLAVTLVTLGLLRRDPQTERFSLGPGVLALAHSFLSGLDVRAIARPRMAELADWSGGSVFLAVRDRLEMVLIEAVRPRDSVLSPTLDVGSRVPLIESALGRACLGSIGQPELDRLLESLRTERAPKDVRRIPRGPEWPAVVAGLKDALRDAATDGLYLSMGSWHRQIHSIAVPLIGPKGEVMALNCGGASFLFTQERLRGEIGPRLLQLASHIAAEIGGSLGQRHEQQKTA